MFRFKDQNQLFKAVETKADCEAPQMDLFTLNNQMANAVQ